MLKVSGLHQYYGGSHILRGLDFEARLGEVTVILGRNGVGKTTLLKSLMGVVPIRSGTVALCFAAWPVYTLDWAAPCDPLNYNSAVPNLAHLLVGSEGTLGVFQTLDLKLSPLPKHRVLGVVNFPTFYRAMEVTQHIVTLGPTAVELVDRTMIDLSRENPLFRPVMDASLIGEPDALLLVEFAGDERLALEKRLADLETLLADLGLPGSAVKMTDAGAQKKLWDVRKAGLNIMMSMKGDGKPVSFIEDCCVPLEHLAEYTRRLTDVFTKHGTKGTWYAHASVGTLHDRPVLDMRRDGATKMRAIAEEAAALVRFPVSRRWTAPRAGAGQGGQPPRR